MSLPHCRRCGVISPDSALPQNDKTCYNCREKYHTRGAKKSSRRPLKDASSDVIRKLVSDAMWGRPANLPSSTPHIVVTSKVIPADVKPGPYRDFLKSKGWTEPS